ncbi:DUF1642 domain-containing protein [Companilactobacillus zhachilii]|uniref:DUF1642 domain-containing protein n=1 Tax=Companilactobacillus zhachilii TaxID=2304606 RepID=A0A386PU71_9LACO|nr:DUF1642 domain-containing protein [Companilactobacillus zhachilii]AYE38419.1 DUF1642 domain-containing protein [Companilactobacillus zhachilii]
MASLKDIKVNINVDTADFIKSLRQLQESIKMDNVRILKGWTKEEREELEDAKETGNLGNFLHNITGYPEDTNCGYVWDNYHKASSREQISIIQDIVDFYTGKAKFSEQKYYIKMPKVNYPYLIRDMGGKFDHAQSPDILGSGENSFTEQEIKAIDSRYMAFAVPVEADDE